MHVEFLAIPAADLLGLNACAPACSSRGRRGMEQPGSAAALSCPASSSAAQHYGTNACEGNSHAEEENSNNLQQAYEAGIVRDFLIVMQLCYSITNRWQYCTGYSVYVCSTTDLTGSSKMVTTLF